MGIRYLAYIVQPASDGTEFEPNAAHVILFLVPVN